MIAEYREQEDFQTRLSKLREIEGFGMCPYPHKYEPTHTADELLELYKDKEIGHSDDAAAGSTPSVRIAGRLVLFRPMGKNIFAQIQDGLGRMQIMANRDLTKILHLDAEKSGITDLKFFEKKLDLGDILGIEGNLFRTQKGEITIFVKRVTLLSKALLPLPDKHSGLADKGVRYRKRWLDLITHADSMKRLKTRSQIIASVRKYLAELSFMEVETPVLQNIYGGAEARPFSTHLNALNQDMFLRISLEISLKKLIIGGLNRIYELGKVFRNEGIDRTHNPEFTMLEAYSTYWDYHDMMAFTENLFETIALQLFGDTKIRVETEGEGVAQVIDLKAPWIRMTMKDAIKTYAKVDVDALSTDELRDLLRKETKADPDDLKNASKGSLIAIAFEELAESHLIQPHHIIDHPIETTPLCKPHRNHQEKADGLVERFETFILASEMANAYTELNDPELQRKLLEDQAAKKAAGDDEAHPLDEEFIEAMCQGMPPTGGVGIGIDRLVMLFTNAFSIRDVLYFPMMRPEDGTN
jgi:lysyl-tRNA synthetase, class II